MNATVRFGRGTGDRSATLDKTVDVSFFDRLTKSDASTADFLGAEDAHWVLNTPAAEPAALEISNVSVSYRKGLFQPSTRVIHDLNLTVRTGEVVGFLGPNGAGKSSTIKAIMGFVAPEWGKITVYGQAAGSTAAKAKIGYLPEVALYYPFLTPMETLRLYGRLQGLGGSALVDESLDLLRRVGLAGKERQQLKTFSKGMQQRLGIAQALLGRPDLLVLDEVTSGLDPIGRRHLREVLREVKDAGTTIFFSSHELDEVAQLCDRVVMIYAGKVVDERPMDDSLRAGIGSALEDYFVSTMERSSLPNGGK